MTLNVEWLFVPVFMENDLKKRTYPVYGSFMLMPEVTADRKATVNNTQLVKLKYAETLL